MSKIMADLKELFPEIIELMPPTFTAHEFIQKLSQKHQVEYIHVLYHYCDNSAEPFTIVHQMFGKLLHDFPEMVRKVGDVKSVNIFGQIGDCSKWEKI